MRSDSPTTWSARSSRSRRTGGRSRSRSSRWPRTGSDDPAFLLPADPSAFGPIGLVTMRDPGAPVPLYLRHPDIPYWYEWLPESRTLYVQSNVISDDGDEPMAGFYARVFAAADCRSSGS